MRWNNDWIGNKQFSMEFPKTMKVMQSLTILRRSSVAQKLFYSTFDEVDGGKGLYVCALV